MSDSPKPNDHSPHRWSGWPRAWCLDCGIEDPYEQALADGYIQFDVDTSGPADGITMIWTDPAKEQECAEAMTCTEPGSKRHDPYSRAAEAKAQEGL